MEDFIFDDDVDDVGAEVEAHCPKCKADTTHVIISKYEDEIRRVQCNPCGDVHAYRKPRGESDEEAEPTPKKKAAKAKPTWEQVMAKSKKQPRAYAIADYFKEMEIVSHPKFGVGYVTENIGADKIEVTFQDDKRVLVHNRKGLNLPISMLRPLAPPDTKKGPKGAKGAKAPAPAKVLKPAAVVKPAAAVKPAAVVKPPVVVKPVVVAKAAPKAAPPAAKKHKAAARPVAKKPAKPARPVAKAAAKASKPVKRTAAPRHAKPVKKLKKSR